MFDMEFRSVFEYNKFILSHTHTLCIDRLKKILPTSKYRPIRLIDTYNISSHEMPTSQQMS